MRFFKRFLATVLSTSMFLSLVVSAQTISEQETSSVLADVRAIALHAPARFSPTSDWLSDDIQITKETPLYDASNNLHAYCVDLKNQTTNETAYVIVATGSTDFPIVGYSPQGVSPYYAVPETQTAIFLSVGSYYIDNGETYTSLSDGKTVDKSIFTLATTENSASLQSIEDYSNIREMYINGTFPLASVRAGVSEKNLTSVPNWEWTYGCCPTAMAMIISYHYGGNKDTLLSSLADFMSTADAGSTFWSKVITGTIDYLNVMRGVTPSDCRWNSSNIFGFPYWGADNNPKSVYKEQIDAGNPVFVACKNASMTSHAYDEAGFEDHGMTGVGYMFSVVDGDYIILHTTATSDGDFYASLESSTFSQYAWGLLIP